MNYMNDNERYEQYERIMIMNYICLWDVQKQTKATNFPPPKNRNIQIVLPVNGMAIYQNSTLQRDTTLGTIFYQWIEGACWVDPETLGDTGSNLILSQTVAYSTLLVHVLQAMGIDKIGKTAQEQ